MESVINKLFEYYDTIFFDERVEIDRFGKMGMHYDGLMFDEYLSNSILDIDYLSIDDYFDKVADVKYYQTESLFSQYSNLDIEKKLKVISAILSLINFSSYRETSKDTIIKKSKAFLQRFGLEVEEKDKYIYVKNELKLFEGSYSEIFLFNTQFYKKQLKDKFKNEETWKKRFKYEYENMEKLSECPYVLKVFDYDRDRNSYLMEKCDCNLFDYLEKNQFICDDELVSIITQIVTGMHEVHQAGILHRDLHLGNILLKGHNIIVSDFGLSKDTMINHSLKSTSTPKNSHFFMDPIGLSDFTKLDKLSDVFSIGKIIDYITSSSELNSKLSYIINKATDRNRNKRYLSLSDLLTDLNSVLKDISKEERIALLEKDIQKGKNSPDVENFILRLSSQGQLSNYIVKKQLNNFGELLLEFNETTQTTLLSNIQDTYSEATGYGHFENYGLFAGIMYRFIRKSGTLKLQRIAYSILEGCASYRYNAKDRLDEINLYYPNLEII
ncbi:tRNA A-37 threonylcarbamoyl transferase component Bud32 [Sedimentibacter acidaminivorans]|uniref:tRNA A-37 threonylcarbamoyl transferase component Bud32 n=1 Tax=Sedimentibacter acidaminivorans TaxID=913099 RepID=A0ABS4GB96_9FIRM|nr:protein kinase [Sedimentibacter acidaminivorans]MBP1924675.1 tRNA A-37 threonylcarbamoyl transferase component Bud32 [Sedimentibacter acidaminivorans]